MEDDYKAWYEEAMMASNEAGCAGMSAAETIRYLAAQADVKAEQLSLPMHRANRIYVAGPMTGLTDLNFEAFNAAATKLRYEGWHVENPAEHGIVDGAQWADYMHTDLQQLSTCCAIYLLPGWSKSRGATLEAHVAQALGMAVYYATNAAAQEGNT